MILLTLPFQTITLAYETWVKASDFPVSALEVQFQQVCSVACRLF